VGLPLAEEVDQIAAEIGVSGAVQVVVDGTVLTRAYGLANRALGVPNTVETQFAMASGSKAFTALVVMRLVEQGAAALGSTVRRWLGTDLPLIDDRVTIEQLLSHRSGIGDYLDESLVVDWNAHLLGVPVHSLSSAEEFLPILEGHPMKFEPGARFDYNNGAFVVLALVAERITGRSLHDLVHEHVCRAAGMQHTAYLRSDELPGRAAQGYLDDTGLRTNVLHLPVRGNGDGGAYTTVDDMRAFWHALFDGSIVAPPTVAEMTRPRPGEGASSLRYGLGFWVHPLSGWVSVHGFDPGVGMVAAHDPRGGGCYTVLCNQSRGAWPTGQRVAAAIESLLGSQ
jgi:CubicO group peptidase (beta-lactamase class C family)